MPIPRRKLTQEQLSKARELKARKFSYEAIKRILHLDCAIETISKAIKNPNYGTYNYTGNQTLSREQAFEIRRIIKHSGFGRYGRGRARFIRNIANTYGICVTHVYNIVRRKVWA